MYFSDPTKPVVTLDPPDRTITVPCASSKQIKVVCRYAGGIPRPVIRWKNPKGKVIRRCHMYSNKCIWTIHKTIESPGRYMCIAKNKAGISSVMINIARKYHLKGVIVFAVYPLIKSK